MMQPYTSLEEELERYAFTFPILDYLAKHWQENNHVRGRKIGWHCHLTGLTAYAARVLLKAGAKLYISECTPNTTDWAAVNYMKQLGASVNLGNDGCRKVLDNEPEIISDTGFALNSEYIKDLEAGKSFVYAGCEITTSGVHLMRETNESRYPIININDGELKALIENFHGVGDGVIEALFRLTWRVWAGRPVAVAGYGRVGAGVANYLRRIGAVVSVVETDPIRKLVAHYDGYALVDLNQALSNSELLVTATGQTSLIGEGEWKVMRDGLIIMNVGHWADEIDINSVRRQMISVRPILKHLEEFLLPDLSGNEENPRRVYLLANGSPANVVLLSGSPEPTLIHLTTELLCMNHLLGLKDKGQALKGGENPVPNEVETQASILALRSLGLVKDQEET